MLDKLSLSLKGYVKNMLGDSAVKIVLRRPSDDYAPEDDTIGLFLYDIAENTELRSSLPFVEYDYSHGTAVITKPPLRLSCTYLITAWAGKNGNYSNEEEKYQKEQQLLGIMIELIAGTPSLPYESLKDNGMTYDQLPLPVISLQRDTNLKPSDLWGAMKSAIKPSFSITVTICVPSHGKGDLQHLYTKLDGDFQNLL